MSHRDLDDIAALHHRLDVLDVEIAAAKRACVVDLATFADMKRRREEIAAQLARFEEAGS